MEFSLKKKILFWIVMCILVLLAVEIALHIIDFIRGGFTDPREELSTYHGKPWAAELIKEQGQCDATHPQVYKQFLGWGSKGCNYKYLNVDLDENGFAMRRTWEPSSTPAADAKTIFMMGASTMFGPGSRDEGTIPSFISKALNANGYRYKVRNYGEGAYVFTQEALKLALLLKDGQRPDYVIFYDGNNDTIAAYDAGQAGALTAEDNIKQQLDSSYTTRIWYLTKALIRDYCEACRVVINISRSFSVTNLHIYDISGSHFNDQQLSKLAEDVSDNYFKTLAFVDRLSNAYGFTYAAFWQPSLFLERPVGDETTLANVTWRLKDQNLAAFYRETTKDALSTKTSLNFYDATNALKGRTTQIYLDQVHVSEDGNQILAAKMLGVLKQKYGL